MEFDIYEGIAERYDLFKTETAKKEKIQDFYRELFDRFHVKNILDCACGTGNDLIMLKQMGYEITGSDLSDSMLAIAHKNLKKDNLDIPVHKIDYRNLPEFFTDKFDAVLCLSSSILHMKTDDEFLKAFKSMHSVLKNEGILVLTQGTADKQIKEQPRFILAFDRDDITRLFVIDYKGKSATYNILDIYHNGAEKGLKTWSVDYPMILLKDDYERILTESGFTKIEFFGNYGFEPYDKDQSNLMIIVASR